MTNETVSAAVSADNLEIPLIDFSAFSSPSAVVRQHTADAIFHGFQTAGFIYIRNHGIPKPAIKAAFASSAQFFRRPKAEKDALAWTTPKANRGYVAQGREKTTDLTDEAEIARIRELEGQDLKETLEIGREGVKGLPNRWPEDAEGEAFREEMLSFFEKCRLLHVSVMRAIAVGLGIDERWFDQFCDGGDNT